MKKRKLPGENFSLKTKKTEAPAIMDWINAQTNLMDSFRYLIENDIRANGIRNLQQFIPAERSALTVDASIGFSLPADLPGAVVSTSSTANGDAAAELAASRATKETTTPTAEPEEDIDEDDIESWL